MKIKNKAFLWAALVIGVIILQFYPYLTVRNDLSKYSEEEKEYINHAIETAKTKGAYIGTSVVKINSFDFQETGFPLNNCPSKCDSYNAYLTVFALGIPTSVYVELDKNGDMLMNFPKRSIQFPLSNSN